MIKKQNDFPSSSQHIFIALELKDSNQMESLMRKRSRTVMKMNHRRRDSNVI